MEVGHIAAELWRLRLWVVAGLLVAAAAAAVVVYRVEPGIPPKFESKSLTLGTASTEVLVDSQRSALGAVSVDIAPLVARARLFGPMVTSKPVRAEVARLLGIPPYAISIVGPPPPGADRGREVSADQRAGELISEAHKYRLAGFAPSESLVVNIFTQGPTAEAAQNLANAAAVALQRYVARLQRDQKVPRRERVRLVQLGEAQGGIVNSGASAMVAGLVFVGALLAWCLLVLLAARVVGAFKDARGPTRDELERLLEASQEPPGRSTVAG